MSVRTNAVVLALAAMALPAAFAQSAGTFVGGEAGWVQPASPGSLAASQVRGEWLAFRSNPVGADGGRHVGGEEGYAFPAHTYALQNGRWVCTDRIAHDPPPAAIRSPAEEKAFQLTYPA